MSIETAWYSQEEQKSPKISLKPAIKQIADKFMTTVKSRKPAFYDSDPVHLFIVNSRKVLLSKVYLNLKQYLETEGLKIQVKDINQIKPGILSNPFASMYLEPVSVTILLPKKHNSKEKSLCLEAIDTSIPLNIIMIHRDTMLFSDKADVNLVIVNSVKDLYILLYALAFRKTPLSYDEFRTSYKQDVTVSTKDAK